MADDDYDDNVDEDEFDGNSVDGNRVDGNTADDGGTDDDYDDDYNSSEDAAPVATAVLDYLTTQLVDEPDEVQIEAVEARGGIRLDVRVADGDMGRVIGRRGRIAQAIRRVVSAAAIQDDTKVSVDFVD